MHTLLLRLAGPMQSWGSQSRFDHRDTEREPTKSGVIGLLCAALGIPRENDSFLQQLAALRMGVRVDREGHIARDYQTAGGGKWRGQEYYVITAEGRKGRSILSERFYLADAEFLVGLEGEDKDLELLRRCHEALAHPRWPLYLGRKSYVPGLPVYLPDGLCRNQSLEEALRNYPRRPYNGAPERLRLVLESREPTSQFRYDQPLSFQQEARTLGQAFRLRFIEEPSFIAASQVPLASGGD